MEYENRAKFRFKQAKICFLSNRNEHLTFAILHPAIQFDLIDASLLDTPEIVHVHCQAWSHDEIWRPLMGSAELSEEHAWLVQGFGLRNSLPDRKVYKIVERVAG